ncbi:hypothetical protein DPEC_G00379950 [Dallia pectoralis]|nr:hypothetical protein DPEC_G00379950 [Dallia pectoralis]
MAINDPKDKAAIKIATMKLNNLHQNKSELNKKEWMAQTELLNNQMKLTRATFDLGAVPDPVHLAEVQKYLSRIQDILLKLKSFWEKIEVMVKSQEKKTFAAENLLEVLQDEEFKEAFLNSLDSAAKGWNDFKCGCAKVMTMFSVQSKDAYKFLEVCPSSLSKEEWQIQYDAVNTKLNAFYPALLEKQASEAMKAIE